MYIILGLILLILIWAIIEQHLLITTKYVIKSDKFNNSEQGISFVLLSDLHNQVFGKQGKRLIAKIDRLSPDIIIVAGDMINKREISYPSHAFTLLEALAKKYKLYYALGNHEQYNFAYAIASKNTSGDVNAEINNDVEDQVKRDRVYSTLIEYMKRLKQAGIIFLDNRSEFLTLKSEKLCISAVTIDLAYYDHKNKDSFSAEYLSSLIGTPEQDYYQLLIAHNPLFFQQYSDWGADLTVSGHMHGGLVRLPLVGGVLSPQVRFFPKYDAGLFEKKNQKMIISKGLGSHSVMFRLFNPPELVFVQLTAPGITQK